MHKAIIAGAVVAGGLALVGRRLRRSDRNEHRVEHVSQTQAAYRRAHTRILILGAGFGGLATALKLDQRLRLTEDVSVPTMQPGQCSRAAISSSRLQKAAYQLDKELNRKLCFCYDQKLT